jgi:ribosomal protein L11 methyltransferase
MAGNLEELHLVLKVTTQPEVAEYLMPLVADFGFDTFEETETGFTTSAITEAIPSALEDLLAPMVRDGLMSYSTDVVKQQNWNAIWEAGIDPLTITPNCRIRAGFHAPDNSIEFDLVITPKMAFGTGHHATTAQVLKYLLANDVEGLRVLDAGSGSGILAILASKRGAKSILAYDNDPWSVESIKENILGNDCTNIDVAEGIISSVEIDAPFELILANINRNILLAEMEDYSKVLLAGGKLILSGFHEQDIDVLGQEALRFGLVQTGHTLENGWAMMVLEKGKQ